MKWALIVFKFWGGSDFGFSQEFETQELCLSTLAMIEGRFEERTENTWETRESISRDYFMECVQISNEDM